MLALRRLAALALLGLAALAAPGCLSPTLPLPPPADPDVVHQEDNGSWLIVGACNSGAIVSVFNRTRGAGVITTCTHGSYAATIQGKQCDVAFISQEIHEEQSSETEFELQEISQGDPVGATCP
jgi:hypothetical protein